MEMHFVSLFFLNERTITTSLLRIHLKCTFVHYVNLNSSFINKPYFRAVEYAISGFFFFLFFFFDFLFIFILTRLLTKTLWENYHFLMQISKIHFKISILQNIRVSNRVILKWQPVKYKAKFGKKKKKGFFYLDPE